MAGVLFCGLRPKDYDFSNKVSLIDGSGGLQFEKYSMVYTQPIGAEISRQLARQDGFTLFLNFDPQPDFDDGFGLMLVMHGGDDAEQLIIGQWKSHIIAMNGDDYAHKRRVPRISFDTSKYLRIVTSRIGKSRIDKSGIDESDFGIQVVLTSEENGTRVYVNGKLIKQRPNLVLKVPAGEGVRLILGASPYGQSSWQGDIHSLAFCKGAFPEKAVERLVWGPEGSAYPNKFGEADAFFAYDFSQINGNTVKDLSGNSVDIHIPDRVVPLEKKILARPGPDLEIDRRLFLDVAINFLGFVPLGFLLAAVLSHSALLSIKQRISLAVLVCFLLSLGIEVAQAWLPSRDSSLLDLVMNTMGGGGGALLIFATDPHGPTQTLFLSLRDRQ